MELERLYHGYIVYGWMGSKEGLGLKSYYKEIYAIIYAFSNDGANKYVGSLNYLMEVTGLTKPTIIKGLDYLVSNLLVHKITVNDGLTPNTYWANLEVVKDIYSRSQYILTKVVNEVSPGSKAPLPNNNISNTINASLQKNKGTGKMIFANSKWNDYLAVRKYFALNPEYIRKYANVDIQAYIEKVLNWGDKSGKQTTERGWIAYIRDFMNSDIEKGSLVMRNKKQPNKHVSLDESLEQGTHVNF